MKQISQGAEAKIYLADKAILKKRIEKSYRIKEIDGPLRKSRTRREAKVLEKLTEIGVPCPKLIKTDDKEMTLEMEHIHGPKLRDILDKKNHMKLAEEIGRLIALMHQNRIIHGDLTTSNMIFSQEKIFFIDFGLSFFSHKVEDMAVDLHLFRQALESRHHDVWEKCFDAALKSYCANIGKDLSKEVLSRFHKVEARGRHKTK